MTDPNQPILLRRLPPEGAVTEESLLEGFLAYVEERGLSLYAAQEEAVLEIFADHSVVLATPTGSGKSLVALAMCWKALAEGRRCYYTAPIKALVSEKFFAMCKDLGPENVGMMTGDAAVNRSAKVICCTAEILANLALRGGKDAPIDYVVMDEFHYYADRERGVAWQVPLLTLPQANFLLMSATLGDTTFFEEGLRTLTRRPVSLVKSGVRPVPLTFEYREVPLHETIADLLEKGRAPIYIVHFTQRAATEAAQNLMSVDISTKAQKASIQEALEGVRFDTPFGKELRRYVRHGVGVHHAGLLPKYRLLVEKLAQRGLLKLICGTDTLGVGVNIPIRTVLFTQLCKFDGEKTKVLSVRDFQQIAGRAGRKGYDDEGFVVAQAPEHEIENKTMRGKAGLDAKKLRKLVYKKPPERGYAHWDEGTFDRLRSSEPERLSSNFSVSHAMLMHVLGGRADGCRAMRQIIADSHEGPNGKRRLRRTAFSMFRSLAHAHIVTMDRDEDGRALGPVLHEQLQPDFSLNQALSLFVVDALERLDRESETYALDLLSLVESVLENPGVILERQADKLKRDALAEMKAAGLEYEERMEELQKIEHPKPLEEFLYDAFDEFRRKHPWVGRENVHPKSIARDMWESAASFRDYVTEYGLQRSEGVLLRYLSDAYKAVAQTIPEGAKTVELVELSEWLGATVRQVDSSLLDEWEALVRGEPEPAARPARAAGEADLTEQVRAFDSLVRTACFRLVRALARRRYDLAAEVFARPGDDADAIVAMRIETDAARYFEAHETIRLDADARSPRTLHVERGPERWVLRQMLLDPDGHDDWYVELELDVTASRELAAPVLRYVRVTSD